MIFGIGDHIQQIINGTKTMTRRSSSRYQVGKLYAIQPCRTCKGIPEGKIYISFKKREWKPDFSDLPDDAKFARKGREMEAGCPIRDWEAIAEGGYNPEEFEELYEKTHPNWIERWAYYISFFSVEDLEEISGLS